jgi:PAS domain S-box-containing protein
MLNGFQEGGPQSLLVDPASDDGPHSRPINASEEVLTRPRRLASPPSTTLNKVTDSRHSPEELSATPVRFPASGSEVRYQQIAVAVVSVITLVLAVEIVAMSNRPILAVLAAATVTFLLPALWVCTWKVHQARCRAVAAYTQTEQRLSAFNDTAVEVLWETTTDGVITYASPRADLLGYTADELVGEGIDIVLAGRDHQRAWDLLSTSLLAGQGWTNERLTFLTRDGHEREMYSSALIHVGTDDQPIGFTGTLRDVEPTNDEDREYIRSHSSVNYILTTQALRTVFQPIVSLSSGAVVGAEALTRFTADPHLTPDVWFHRAADVGLGVELELLALHTALSSAGALPRHIYLSVNLSPQALAADGLVETLTRASWPCSQLVVEITEHVSVSDYADLLAQVQALRDLGIRIAVDDAGAGYASFRHILQLRPDYIKLDRGLVDGLDHDPAKRALAGAFVTFGREVDATIIAEGVENGLEVRAARALGMHAAQGYHLGRPAPADRVWGRSTGR